MDVDEIIEGVKETLDSNGETDNILLHDGLGKVQAIASFILGLLIVGILILIPLVIAVELMYINIPFIREPVDRLAEIDNKFGTAVGLVCRDARRAVRESIVSGGSINTNMRYLTIKMKSTVVIVFMVALIVQGTSMVITKSYGLMSGFIDVILRLI